MTNYTFLAMEPEEPKFNFYRFRMFFNRLNPEQKDKLLQKYGICSLEEFNKLSEKNKQFITLEANTELYNSLVAKIRNFSGYELCLLYNYVKQVPN
jgi:hypothetical protein